MTRYYFHVHDSAQIIDTSGTELADLSAARRHAVNYASSLLVANPEQIWKGDTWSMEITDKDGFLFFRIDIAATPARRLAS